MCDGTIDAHVLSELKHHMTHIHTRAAMATSNAGICRASCMDKIGARRMCSSGTVAERGRRGPQDAQRDKRDKDEGQHMLALDTHMGAPPRVHVQRWRLCWAMLTIFSLQGRKGGTHGWELGHGPVCKPNERWPIHGRVRSNLIPDTNLVQPKSIFLTRPRFWPRFVFRPKSLFRPKSSFLRPSSVLTSLIHARAKRFPF